MNGFDGVKRAMRYIEAHLDTPLTLEDIAGAARFSPYYFHRLFRAITGVTVADYVRERRLNRACRLLTEGRLSVTVIGMESGFTSPQAFSRAFKTAYGVTPGHYRKMGMATNMLDAAALERIYTNRLMGGVIVNPRIIRQKRLFIAGVTGDGTQTGAVWETFMAKAHTIIGNASDNGYEVRLYRDDGRCDCHVGYAVLNNTPQEGITILELPPSQYAAFDVYVAKGYDSENNAMEKWLAENEQGYMERLLDGKHYCVEFYDERFSGEDEHSIVEIWIPIEKEHGAQGL